MDVNTYIRVMTGKQVADSLRKVMMGKEMSLPLWLSLLEDKLQPPYYRSDNMFET